MSSEIVLWIIVIFMFLTNGLSHKVMLRVIVSMLLKIAQGQVLNSKDVNTLQELEKKLGIKQK